MDFKEFRDTGELSDIGVTVEDKTFKLHKFPLYIRSEYFKGLVQGSDAKDNATVVLKNFPGGVHIFEIVADFCYNIKVNLSRENVCLLRFAAQYLEMTSAGNLAELCDKYLDDVLASAHLSRDVGAIADIMHTCLQIDENSYQLDVMNKCINAVVEFWLAPTSKFTLLHKSHENVTVDPLTSLPLCWLLKIVETARERNVNPRILVSCVERIITKCLIRASKESVKQQQRDDSRSDEKANQQADNRAREENKDALLEITASDNEQQSQPIPDDNGTDTQDVITNEQEADGADVRDHNEKADRERDEKSTELILTYEQIEGWQEQQREDIKELLDTLLLALPEDAPFVEVFPASWVVETLKVVDTLGCSCRPLLVKLASRMLQRFSISELIRIRPAVLCEVIERAVADTANLPGVVCGVLDNYLLELAQNQQLPVHDFRALGNAVPPNYRPNHDALFQVLELILQTAKADIDDDQKKDLFDVIDFKRLGEETLERAYDENLIPQAYVTKAALALCKKLRVELDNARTVIRMQEEELTQMSRHLSAAKSKPWAYGDSGYGDSKVGKYGSARHSYGSHSFSHKSSKVPLSSLSPRSHSTMVDILEKVPTTSSDTSYRYTPFKSYIDDHDLEEFDSAYDSTLYRKYSSRPVY